MVKQSKIIGKNCTVFMSALKKTLRVKILSAKVQTVHAGTKSVSHTYIQYIRKKAETLSIVKQTPVAAISWCQCRSRMAGFWSSVTARSDVRRFFTLLSKPVKASHSLTWQEKQARNQCKEVFPQKYKLKITKKEGLLLFAQDKPL